MEIDFDYKLGILFLLEFQVSIQSIKLVNPVSAVFKDFLCTFIFMFRLACFDCFASPLTVVEVNTNT